MNERYDDNQEKFETYLNRSNQNLSKYLDLLGFTKIEFSQGIFSDWDVKANFGEVIKTIEAKEDFKAQETGNCYIEATSKYGKPSGIAVTKADLWMHIVVAEDCVVIYFLKPQDILQAIKEKKYTRKTMDGNYLFSFSEMNKMAKKKFKLTQEDINNESSYCKRQICD